MEKPFSPSCERNQQVILEVLKSIIKPHHKNLFEIGSGTGQHAVYMAPHFKHLIWHTSELLENHEGIELWIKDSECSNVMSPIEFEVGKTNFPSINADLVFSTNTLHIMSWENVKLLIKQLGQNLVYGAEVIIYGPFNYDGKYTSDSNAEFDEWLIQQNPYSAIRDFELVVELMQDSQISLMADIPMPANNRILHFVKIK